MPTRHAPSELLEHQEVEMGGYEQALHLLIDAAGAQMTRREQHTYQLPHVHGQREHGHVQGLSLIHI